MGNRAVTKVEKWTILVHLYAAWIKVPDLRLGQLIENAMATQTHEGRIFYVEDKTLAEHVTAFADASSPAPTATIAPPPEPAPRGEGSSEPRCLCRMMGGEMVRHPFCKVEGHSPLP